MPWRSKNRQTEPIPTFSPCSSASRRRISFRVRSGSRPTRSSSHCSWAFRGDRLSRERGFTRVLPVSRHRLTQRIAVESPISKCRAAPELRRLSRSSDHPNPKIIRIASPHRLSSLMEASQNLIRGDLGIPYDSDSVENALASAAFVRSEIAFASCSATAAIMWIVSRFACGKSTASNSTPASISADTNATLRASRSSLAMISVAP